MTSLWQKNIDIDLWLFQKIRIEFEESMNERIRVEY